MSASGRGLHHPRLAMGARVLALVILAVPAFVLAETRWLVAVLVLAGIWSLSTLADRLFPSALLIPVLEALLVGAVVGRALEQSPTVLGALAVPVFTIGLRGGVRGVALAVTAELTTLLAVHAAVAGWLSLSEATDAIMWMLTGVGLGLIASYLRSEEQRLTADPLTPYRDAQKLIRELLEISGDLGSGLDPITLGTRIAVAVRNELPIVAVAVHVQRGDHLTPLVAGSSSATVDQSQLAVTAVRAWESQRHEIDGLVFSLPLRTNAGPVAVVSGLLPEGMAAEWASLRERLDHLGPELFTLAVHLDTAMLFTRLRDAATADERRRLAREMHDGVAQDIASLGYLVDALAAAPASPAQAELLRRLRERISAVVSQVRLSVQTLRTDVQASESLGAALNGLARHLGESSGIPIRVTVSERTTRLRPEIEAELLRIAQEAMTNAVRHSHATAIDVSCRVTAPTAEILIRDDGRGLSDGRPDSFGLAIMRERAGLIDADLTIEPFEPHGTVVTVRVPSRHASASRTSDARPDRVTA